MAGRTVSLVHSLSMFQPSLAQSTNTYKPPLFTSSCNSIPEASKPFHVPFIQNITYHIVRET